jgi:hypothetical protein
LSDAVTAMANGDVLVLGKGTYTQTIPVTVSGSINRFSILGHGIGHTYVTFTNTNGFVQSSYGAEENGANAKLSVVISGMTIYQLGTDNTYTGICFEGYRNSARESYIFRDLSLYYWKYALDLRCFWGFVAEDVYVNQFLGGSYGVGSTGYRLLSCVNGMVRGGSVERVQYGAYLRSVETELGAWTFLSSERHACEGINFDHWHCILSKHAVFLYQEKASGIDWGQLAIGVICPMFDQMVGGVINEYTTGDGAAAGGYHTFTGGWIGLGSSAIAGDHEILVCRPGTKITGMVITGSGSVARNGITLFTGANLCSVTGNIIRFNYNQLVVYGDKNSITGNTFEANRGGNEILFIAGGDNNIYTGNVWENAYGVSDSGSGNTAGHNIAY